MEIRKANLADIPAIATLYIKNWKATYQGILSQNYLDHLDLPYGERKWTAFLENPKQCVFVAYEGDLFLGFTACRPDDTVEDCFYLDSLHVDANARGKGLGTRLIQAVGRHAMGEGYRKMTICIVKGNENARNLYTKLGAVHLLDFMDDFGNITLHSEKLLWEDLAVFQKDL